MSEIANLNKIRKQRQRSADRKTAAGNRERFGQSKHASTLTRFERKKQDRLLDGSRVKDDKT